MDANIKKLTSYIDEIVVWIRENPGIEVPNREVLRLTIALENLFIKSNIPIELWNEIKPIRKEDPRAADVRLKKAKNIRIKKMIQEVRDIPENKKLIAKTNRLKEENIKFKQGVKRYKLTETVNGVLHNICPYCSKSIKSQDFKTHKEKCRPLIGGK